MSSNRYSDYCHVTPGRMRVRVTNLRNNREAAKSLQVLMASQPGIKHVCANPVTGNVLVLFSPDVLACEDVLKSLADLGHYPGAARPIARTSTISPEIENQFSEIGVRIAKVALKRALSGSPAAILLELL